jgi:DegV family protein with EDD domain
MSKVVIVTDSTVNLPESYIKEYDIRVVPQILIWGDKTYEDGVDIQANEFYRRLKTAEVMPSSSQVSPETFKNIFSDLLAQDYEILAVVVSAKLSGTINSVTQAMQALPGAPIQMVDSMAASMALGFQVLQAARAAKNGASLKECRAVAERARMNCNVFFMVDTLEFLHRGGRIGGASRFLGTALNLKPILTLAEGRIEPVGKVRTQKKALEKLLTLVEKGLDHSRQNRISVLHADAAEIADEFMQECIRRFQPAEAILTEISPVIGTHTGPGTIGLAYLRDM